jgi:hypothetical protein
VEEKWPTEATSELNDRLGCDGALGLCSANLGLETAYEPWRYRTKDKSRDGRSQDEKVERTMSQLRGRFEMSVIEAMIVGERMKLALLDSLMGNNGRMTA